MARETPPSISAIFTLGSQRRALPRRESSALTPKDRKRAELRPEFRKGNGGRWLQSPCPFSEVSGVRTQRCHGPRRTGLGEGPRPVCVKRKGSPPERIRPDCSAPTRPRYSSQEFRPQHGNDDHFSLTPTRPCTDALCPPNSPGQGAWKSGLPSPLPGVPESAVWNSATQPTLS